MNTGGPRGNRARLGRAVHREYTPHGRGAAWSLNLPISPRRMDQDRPSDARVRPCKRRRLLTALVSQAGRPQSLKLALGWFVGSPRVSPSLSSM